MFTSVLTRSAPFWSRQLLFDLALGVIIPILLLIFDPVIFRNQWCFGIPILANYALFAYLAIGMGILTLLAWLFILTVRQHTADLAAGVLLTGGLVAGIIGVVILPFSLIGLFIGIGVLGLIPFVTASVYFRNGIRAFQLARSLSANKLRLIASFILGSLLVLGLPALAQAQVSKAIDRSVDDILLAPSASRDAYIDALKTTNALCLSLCTSSITAAFVRASYNDTDHREQIASIYQQITGNRLILISCSIPSV